MTKTLPVALLLLAAVVRAHVYGVDATHIEGPNVPDEPHRGVCNHNCQAGGICTAFLFAPQPALQQTFLCVTACQQTDTDPLPHLPPGDYEAGRSVCPSGWAPVCTAQALATSYGSDGGCDRPGVRADSLLRSAPTPKPIVQRGRCHVARHGTMKCRWRKRP